MPYSSNFTTDQDVDDSLRVSKANVSKSVAPKSYRKLKNEKKQPRLNKNAHDQNGTTAKRTSQLHALYVLFFSCSRPG